jgi:hypothetical protein
MKWFIVLLLALGSVGVALSQERDVSFRRYFTQKVYQRLSQQNPSLINEQNDLNVFVSKERRKIIFKKVTIPVVFHIVYSSGQLYPSEEQVYSQIEALNRDFSKQSYRVQHPADTLEGFSRKAQDMQIEFCLAKEGPSGKTEPAIRFIPSTSTEFKDDDLLKTQRFGSPAWDTEQYLNIWVANLADSISGYAQMPGGPDETDGIVIDYRYFGTLGTARAPYDEGKTLTHLAGNYLGLYDLWREDILCADDFVEDTPIHNAPNLQCPLYKQVTTCLGNSVEMTMNFMDNTYDACLYMFTLGQKERMQAILSEGGPRYKLASSNVKCTNNFGNNANNVVHLPTAGENATSLQPFIVNIYPNPAFTEFKVQIKANTESGKQVKISIVNAIGALQLEQMRDLNKGVQEFIINCRNWSPGMYYITLQTDRQFATHHIVVGR